MQTTVDCSVATCDIHSLAIIPNSLQGLSSSLVTYTCTPCNPYHEGITTHSFNFTFLHVRQHFELEELYIYIYVYVDPLWKAWSFANAVSVNLGPKRCIEFKHDIICTFTLTLDVRNSLECVTPFCCIVWNRTESISQDCRLKRPSIVYNHRLKMPCNLDHWIGASYKPNWGQLMETKENVRNPYSTAAMSSWNQCLSCSFWAYELMKLQSPQRPFALSRIFVPKMSKCHKSTWFWVL